MLNDRVCQVPDRLPEGAALARALLAVRDNGPRNLIVRAWQDRRRAGQEAASGARVPGPPRLQDTKYVPAGSGDTEKLPPEPRAQVRILLGALTSDTRSKPPASHDDPLPLSAILTAPATAGQETPSSDSLRAPGAPQNLPGRPVLPPSAADSAAGKEDAGADWLGGDAGGGTGTVQLTE